MTTPNKPSKKEAKKFIQSKAYFSSPYSSQWSSITQEDMLFILKTVQDKFVSSGLQKKEVKVFRRWGRNKSAPPEDEKVTSAEKNKEENGWTDLSVRRQLAIGINEVTKCLERNELELVLVCKSVKPSLMTEHLIPLSASRAVAACQVPRLSGTMSQTLGLKSVLALGFKRPLPGHSPHFTDVIEAITPRVPALCVPWLQPVSSTDTTQDSGPIKTEQGQERGLKRKLESDTEQKPANTLQPLKVKKIVANPAKKRKAKSKQKS